MTWADMKAKYPDMPYREDMSEEREMEYVDDCFSCYENEGFAKKFWSMGSDFKEYHGKSFEVISRVPVFDKRHPNGADLECLPMWHIRFEDGFEMAAYPDEIIPREMISNGCPRSFFEKE